LPYGSSVGFLALLGVEYLEGEPETYLLPLALAAGEQARRVLGSQPGVAVARLQGDVEGVLHDALYDPGFCTAVLEALGRGEVLPGEGGRVTAWVGPQLARARGPED